MWKKSATFARKLKTSTEMTKKKSNKSKAEKSAVSLSETLGFNKLFENERLNFFLGVLLFVASIYMALAFASFFTTGAADQSVIEKYITD